MTSLDLNKLIEEIERVGQEFTNDFNKILNKDEIRIIYLGRKQGKVTKLYENFKDLSTENKRKIGPKLADLKKHIESSLSDRGLQEGNEKMDITIPSLASQGGTLHPITQATNELVEIFCKLGFDLAEGPEIETDWYNFTALNIPELHPARDMWDTFYIDGDTKSKQKLLLRTHTSPVQIRYMEANRPPLSVIVPGRTFRHEATDATHEHTFDQLEGLVVAKNITIRHLYWTIDHVLREFFGPEAQVTFRPSFFPFVEPGLEVSLRHPRFRDGQSVELMGAGMVHPAVFKAVNIDYRKFSGFAFGFGLTRFASMKFGIPDIRLFSENNFAFLNRY